MLRMIAALDSRRGIADEHGIPWQGKIPTDSKYFREQTQNGLILMGYGTYKEFDTPLHDRENYVVVHPDTEDLRPGFAPVSDATHFFEEHSRDIVWVIGGAALFATSLPLADELFLTQLEGDFHCTKFFPAFKDAFRLTVRGDDLVDGGVSYRFETWERA